MSFVLDVPVQLLLTFLLALPAGEAVRPLPNSGPAPAIPVVVRVHQAFGEGAFKFGEQAWLVALKVKPSAPEAERYSQRIFKTSDDFHYVPKANERRAILALRQIPAIAQGVAVRFAQHNAKQLRRVLGRRADASELYLAHCLGVKAAARLIRSMQSRPDEPAYFYVAKVAPDFLIEDLVPTPDATLADLQRLLKRSISEAMRKASEKNLFRAWKPDLRNSFAAVVASTSRNTNVASVQSARAQ